MFLGLKNLARTPPFIDNAEVYNAFLDIHKAIHSTEFSYGSGWASYADTLRTVGAPQNIAAGVTAALLNNAGSLQESYKQADAASLYNAALNKIVVPYLGDYYIITATFKCKPSANNMHIDFALFVGGTTQTACRKSVNILKGIGVEQDMEIVCPIAVGADFLANGAEPRITPQGGSLQVYNVEFQVVRVFSVGTPSQ